MSGFVHSLSMAALGVAALVAIPMTPASAGDSTTADTVVELFTSQGCSSCPPADKVAGELTKRDHLIILSMPVDYWDYLGWKDTFAKHAFTERQRDYARARGDGQVYTPQVVVNGLAHAVGSEAGNIEAAISATNAQLAGKRVALKLVKSGDGVDVQIGDAPAGVSGDGAKVILADFKSSADVKIGRGENGGSKVTYFHVVRELKSIGDWSGKAQSIHLTMADLTAAGSDGCAVFLQAGKAGAILGSAQLTSW